LATATGDVTLANVFNTLPHDLRRPVEVFGLLPLIHTHGMTGTGGAEVLETIRPDGTGRRLQAPMYVCTRRSRGNHISETSAAEPTTQETL
jgi:hypothetical protein